MKIRREAIEVRLKKKDRDNLRLWRCDECQDHFATLRNPKDPDSSEDYPNCCPNCGVIFEGHTVIP